VICFTPHFLFSCISWPGNTLLLTLDPIPKEEGGGNAEFAVEEREEGCNNLFPE